MAVSIALTNLQNAIEKLYVLLGREFGTEYFRVFKEFKAALNEGRIRAAEPDPASPTGWKVNTWVKKGILLGFRIGRIVEMPPNDLQFRDKHTFPLKHLPANQNVRVVPGGSSIR